jgi:hypothetical protein
VQASGAAAAVGLNVIASTSSALGMAARIKGGLMQSSYHMQLLAMTGTLAAPGVHDSYREFTTYFKW